MISIIKSLLRIVVGILIAIPLLLYPFLYLAQEKLLFLQQPRDYEYFDWVRQEYPSVEELQIKTPDNITLHGWLVKNQFKKPSPLLIYFGGNAEEVSGLVRKAELLTGWSLLLVNYRGYGLSEGSPSQKALFDDAVWLYDTLTQRADIDSNQVLAFGRSLGTGVAVHLAAQRPLRGIILVSPYDSVRNVAQRVYFYAPVSLLLKHPFDSLAVAPSIKVPMLALIAEHDRIIPHSHSYALIDAWGGVTEQYTIPNSNHNNMIIGQGYWEYITAFLDSIRFNSVSKPKS
jgi:pimeloyl-ACP methyl ester carboxylesterase